MTIDEAGAAPMRGETLIARMREVHAQATDSATVDGASVDKTPAADRVDLDSLERVDGVDAADPVQRRLLETAREALNGEYDGDVRAIRASVIDEIFDETWSERLPAERRETIGGVVREALTDDLAFRTEVDHMLLHAARLLGRAGAQ